MVFLKQMDLTGFGRGSRHALKGPGTRTTDSPAATVAEIQLELDEAEQLAEAMALSAKEEVALMKCCRKLRANGVDLEQWRI